MGDFSGEGGGTLPQNTFPGRPMRSYHEQRNHIGSVFSESLLYTLTQTHTYPVDLLKGLLAGAPQVFRGFLFKGVLRVSYEVDIYPEARTY